MELSELTVQAYTELLGSDAPAPGGGSASALAGAQGAALTAMVCALTLGRTKYAEYQALAEESFLLANRDRESFLELMQLDTEAFNRFRESMALPKRTEEEKTARKQAMETAALGCTQVPVSVMRLAVSALKLTRSLVGKSNRNAVSDMGVAALSLRTALEGAWLNVRINLPGLAPEDAAALEQEGRELLETGVPLAEEIAALVHQEL